MGAHTAGLNRVAAEIGVEPVPSFAALLLGDLTLVTDVPEVLGLPRAEVDGWTPRDPRRYRPGTRLRYTGPLYAHLDLPVPDQVRAFLAGRRPVIYVAITSSIPGLVRQVVRALEPTGAQILVAGTTHDLPAGIEGTGSYGAGLARHIGAAGVRVVEVDRADRQDRRRRGKSDPLDAVGAARAAQCGRAAGAPKGRDGAVEAIRALTVAKRSACNERTRAINQARSLIVTGPEACPARKSPSTTPPDLPRPRPHLHRRTRLRSTLRRVLPPAR